MTDYVKPCIRESNTDYAIIHVGTNDLNSETTLEGIVEINCSRGEKIKTENHPVNISGIVPSNDNLKNKAFEVNQELLKMCKEAQFCYIDHKSVKPRTHLI